MDAAHRGTSPLVSNPAGGDEKGGFEGSLFDQDQGRSAEERGCRVFDHPIQAATRGVRQEISRNLDVVIRIQVCGVFGGILSRAEGTYRRVSEDMFAGSVSGES